MAKTTKLELKPDPRNANRHDDRSLSAVSLSVARLGAGRSIVVDSTGTVIGGEATLKAAQQLGLKLKTVRTNGEELVVVVREDMGPDDPRRRALALADNQTGKLSEFDDEALVKELRALGDDQELLTAIGFDDAELMALLNPEAASGDVTEDTAPEPQALVVTRPGDVWVCGSSRVYCGDLEAVLPTLADASIDMIFTDPPYGHNNNNNGDLIQRREAALGKPQTKSSAARPIANDGAEDTARVFALFVEHANRLLKPGCCCCCCCCGGGGPDPQFARWSLLLDEGIGFKQAIVWDKGGLGMGWHYRRNYEFVLVAEKPGAACRWFGGHDVANVIRDIGKIIPSAEQHPTEKPVALPALFLKLHSEPGDLILDPFCGSGSTLSACIDLGRKCVAVDVDPVFVDMSVRRWQAKTNQHATRESDGAKFDDIEPQPVVSVE